MFDNDTPWPIIVGVLVISILFLGLMDSCSHNDCRDKGGQWINGLTIDGTGCVLPKGQ